MEREQPFQRVFDRRHVRAPRRFRRHGEIVNVLERLRPGAGIAGMLMDRGKNNLLVTAEDGFSAVPVMRVEIPNGDTLTPTRERIQRGDGDVIEITKSHRLRPRRVMAGRTHQAKTRLALDGCARDLHRGPGSTRGVIVNSRIRGRIGIEIDSRLTHRREVCRRVCAQQRRLVSRRRLARFPAGVARAQERHALRNASGSFHMARAGILHAPGIMENDHGRREPRLFQAYGLLGG